MQKSQETKGMVVLEVAWHKTVKSAGVGTAPITEELYNNLLAFQMLTEHLPFQSEKQGKSQIQTTGKVLYFSYKTNGLCLVKSF